MRAAVYSGTRNVYKYLYASAKSLLIHSNVEKIYFLIEDDIFPYELPKEIECINVGKQTYFLPDSPNYENICTYMVLLRAAYTKIFPNLDKILTIDMDAIVNEDISELWDLDLTDYYLAAVEEDSPLGQGKKYFNMGIAMLNLKKIREDHKDDELIQNLNTYWYQFKEQDCFNEVFYNKVLFLPSDYNACIYAKEPEHEKITHFAGISNLDNFPHFNYYNNLSLNKFFEKNITLDIIIPTYKNKKGLRKTLNSIFIENENKDFNVIVIDDNSQYDYSDILNEYPQIKFYQLESNQGPGMARQYGIEHSSGTYFMFVDTGDYFYENGLKNILKQINKNTYIKMYDYSYVYDNNNVLSDHKDDKTIGSIFKRSFIEMYNIHFCQEGSYANEDYGFSRACRIILNDLEKYGFKSGNKLIKIPVLYEHIDKDSLTKRNNNDFFYTKLSKGIIINGLHAISIAENNNVNLKIIIEEYNRILALEYFIFTCLIYERPELLEETWNTIKEFYFNYYKKYSKVAIKTLSLHYKKYILQLRQKIKSNIKINVNIKNFLQEFETEDFIPIKYYHMNN